MSDSFLYRTVFGTNGCHANPIMEQLGFKDQRRQLAFAGFRDIHFDGDTIILTFRTTDDRIPEDQKSYAFLKDNPRFVKEWTEQEDPSFIYFQYSAKNLSLEWRKKMMADDPYHDPRPPIVKMKDMVQRFVQRKKEHGDFQMKELLEFYKDSDFKEGEEERAKAALWEQF